MQYAQRVYQNPKRSTLRRLCDGPYGISQAKETAALTRSHLSAHWRAKGLGCRDWSGFRSIHQGTKTPYLATLSKVGVFDFALAGVPVFGAHLGAPASLLRSWAEVERTKEGGAIKGREGKKRGGGGE